MKPDQRKRLSKPQRRDQILEAALDVFAAKGFEGARTKEIARRAGISETLIFQHFKTKFELYRAALGHLFGGHPVMPDIEAAMAIEDDAGVLRALATHILFHSRQDPRIMRLALFSALEGMHFGEIADHDRDTRQTMPNVLAHYLEKRIGQGALKPLNAQLAARFFLECIFLYVADQEAAISGPPLAVSDAEAVETLVQIFLNGLAH